MHMRSHIENNTTTIAPATFCDTTTAHKVLLDTNPNHTHSTAFFSHPNTTKPKVKHTTNQPVGAPDCCQLVLAFECSLLAGEYPARRLTGKRLFVMWGGPPTTGGSGDSEIAALVRSLPYQDANRVQFDATALHAEFPLLKPTRGVFSTARTTRRARVSN